MRFENEIEVAQPPRELFAFLTDVERVAPSTSSAATSACSASVAT